jgi:hypothetical protein
LQTMQDYLMSGGRPDHLVMLDECIFSAKTF